MFGGPGFGAASCGVNVLDKASCTRTIALPEKMVSLTVQIVSYAKMETIEVPLKLSMGLGFR